MIEKTISIYGILEQYSFKERNFVYEKIVKSFSSEDELPMPIIRMESFALHGYPDELLKQVPLNDVLKYYTDRLDQTRNNELKVKYNISLFYLSKNNKYAMEAVNVLYHLLETEGNKLDGNQYSEQLETIVETIFELSLKIKYNLEKLSATCKDFIEKDSNFPINKAQILALYDSHYSRQIKITNYSKLCLKTAKALTDYWKERTLQRGIKYSGDDLITKKKLYYELGIHELNKFISPDSDPNNIAIPHLNHRILRNAMVYFKESGALKKYNETEKKYKENSKKLEYIRIVIPFEFGEPYKKHMFMIREKYNNCGTDDLIKELITLEHINLLKSEKIKEIVEGNKGSFIHEKLFEPQSIDINGNSSKTSYEIENFHFIYENYLDIIINETRNILYESINSKNITFSKLKSFLIRHSFWGHSNGLDSLPFNTIEEGLKSIWYDFKITAEGRKANWEIAITVLCLKFEPIIRSILEETEGTTTLKIYATKIKEITLESLLSEDKLLVYFSKDDIDFWKFVFTTQGINLRNNIAHGFLKPQHYTENTAILVFLSILRLSKFKLETKTT